FILEPLGWRQVFLLLALPAVFVFVIRWWIPESPRWLEQAGKGAEAEAVLAQMEARVMKSLGVTQLPTPEGVPRGAVHQHKTSILSLLRPQLRRRTLMIWGLWFFALLGFYGLTTWLGALLQQAGYAVTQSVLYTVTISVGGIPGFLTVAWLIERWGRKRMCLVTLFGSAIMATLYGQVAQAGVSLVLLFSVGFFMQFFMFGMWAVLYAYTPELYDTHVRATGSGCASAIGRIGSLLGPFIVGLILPWTGQGGVFMLGAGSFVVAAFVVWAWGIETKGLSLEAVQQQARGGDHPSHG
ncbi:MAG: MFS transporter, partial [Neisseriaceae bacterium]|nr:MFS transporter [Neisseriaceae bacterium]